MNKTVVYLLDNVNYSRLSLVKKCVNKERRAEPITKNFRDESVWTDCVTGSQKQ